jgi:hypothetical protein
LFVCCADVPEESYKLPSHRQCLPVVRNADSAKTCKLKNAILTFIAYYFCSVTYGQGKLDATYVGLEEMCYTDSTGIKDCYTDPSNPKWKWYHLSFLKLKGDSVFMQQNPIAIHKKDTTFSASDGGFYYYSGTFSSSDTALVINLKEISCDYCGKLTKKIRMEHWNGNIEQKNISPG